LPFVLVLTGSAGRMPCHAAIWLVRHAFRDPAAELLRWGWGKLQPARP